MSELEGGGGLFARGAFLVSSGVSGGGDEESISNCPLLTPSPTVADFQHPLAISTTPVLEYDRQLSPSSVDTEASSVPPAGSSADFTQDNVAKGIQAETRRPLVDQCQEGSSSSSSCSVMQDSTASAQLLNCRNYMTLAVDANCQENGGLKPSLVGLTLGKSTQEFGFTSWNWTIIRRWCFWGVMSITVACVCVIIGYITTIPTRCDPPRSWYQGGLIYQIFPASFQDSDSNGIGDFQGIISRIHYLEELGVKGVRLSYIFQTQHYPEYFDKVENLTKLEPNLGTIDDFRLLIETLHSKNISLILDLPLYPFYENMGNSKETMVQHVIINNHILVTPLNKTHLEDIDVPHSQKGPITQVLAYWLSLGVDGFYLYGLENYLSDDHFLSQLNEWKHEMYSYNHGFEKILICTEEVITALKGLKSPINDSEVKLNAILRTFDLVDVRLDPFTRGANSIRNQLLSAQSVLYARPGYPWIYWSLGGIDSSRLASRAPFPNASLGLILASMMLPGSNDLFYGDEIGLQDISDPEGERSDLEHAHSLVPMQWTRITSGIGFTHGSQLPWLPMSKASLPLNSVEIIAAMSLLRDDNPPIYMHALWTNNKLQPNTAIRYADNYVLCIERTYPRRHAFLLAVNFGKNTAIKDLSSIYYGGVVVLDNLGKVGRYIKFQDLTLQSGQVIVTKLDK
ncbi:hypothetical protein AAG570_006465 [Ranatra chinensis]|uniref:Glycosyl hydrolase family 13 catalytic domain-containing protein n=1 Tax=Ranatra chinensis TaxID=642074 RepID=A0ABD0YU56_9HEMI